MTMPSANDGAPASALYASASLDCAAAQPVTMLESSVSVGWNALLLDHVEGVGQSDVFETHATTDLTLVTAIGGRHRVEAYGCGTWHAAIYEPGAAGMTPPGQTARLRWEALGSSRRFEMIHLYLPQAIVNETCEEYRRRGQRTHDRPLDALVFNDPTVAQLSRALLVAMHANAPDLYADQVARAMALHLLATHSPWLDIAADDRDPGTISDDRLARVIEYMSANLDRSLTVLELAREAGISVHHFSRRFRKQTGRTPCGFLTDLRFDLARRLLWTTDLPIGEIGLKCGYTQAAAFSAAFQRRYGKTPSAEREQGGDDRKSK
ncbi:AraC family transcriptional regulator [Novosphingobium chloroacetimidivorans]|uniref:AraC family transcriptional regulator n=1 Tax=Novosphingobium chloroacetimidivorans TaxID=1428314 RepID=A0A7W7KB53_9SPHN|nr:helix-turn-helix domain-containing protein [Novosphingobium chloroacetimidivorans]MBB4859350.1 AraC family transcriptional regulator [Novosphingobium chloroacetimidivorans]